MSRAGSDTNFFIRFLHMIVLVYGLHFQGYRRHLLFGRIHRLRHQILRVFLKEGTQGADHFHREDDHIDQQDAEEHHHGIFLHLLRALSCLFF